MICKRCGAKFSDGMFCPECGARTTPVSGSGESQVNTWEAALEYTEGEGYNTKMYGPQGQLEEQRIATAIKIEVGGKKVFENKNLIFKESIDVSNNTKLEFRNCALIIDIVEMGAIWTRGSNVSINFENCVIKGNNVVVKDSSYLSKINKGTVLEFRNCAFIDGEEIGDWPYYLINMHGGSTYFENCFIKERLICTFEGRDTVLGNGLVQKLSLRNCVIVNESKDVDKCPDDEKHYLDLPKKEKFKRAYLIEGTGESDVEIENCFIRSKKRLVRQPRQRSGEMKLNIKNSYFDNYSCIMDGY